MLTALKNMAEIDLDKILIENVLKQKVYRALARNCPSDGYPTLVLNKDTSMDDCFFVNATAIDEALDEEGIKDLFYPDWKESQEEADKANSMFGSLVKCDGVLAMELIISERYSTSMSAVFELERKIINDSNIEIYDLIIQELCEDGYSSMATAKERVIALILLGEPCA